MNLSSDLRPKLSASQGSYCTEGMKSEKISDHHTILRTIYVMDQLRLNLQKLGGLIHYIKRK